MGGVRRHSEHHEMVYNWVILRKIIPISRITKSNKQSGVQSRIVFEYNKKLATISRAKVIEKKIGIQSQLGMQSRLIVCRTQEDSRLYGKLLLGLGFP